MFETPLTVVGNLTTGVDIYRLADGSALGKFRVASTERRYDRAEGGWGDGDSLYLDVRCRRDLAENAGASLVKGDPVVVTGKLYTRTYEHAGQHRSVVTLEASSVAPDLARCRTVVTRTRRRGGSAPADPDPQQDGGRAPVRADPAAGPDASVPVGGVSGDAAQLVGAAPGNESR